jgi:hypothetical protein
VSAPDLRVLSLGAGVQSTTLALMAARGEFPERLDAAIFADTGWEPAAVYRHLEWLRSVLPFPVHLTNNGNIREAILARRNTTGGRFAAVPWFITNPDGSTGMGRRQCSSEHKLTPIMWKTRELLGKGRSEAIRAGAVEVWIGISRDEASRMKPARQRYMVNRWPLIERDMTRSDCLKWLASHGYPQPPKSACIGCPFHNARMWREMRDHAPVEFADAVLVDAALRQGDARGMRGLEYMHASRKPLQQAVDEQADVDDMQPNLFENECEGICGV